VRVLISMMVIALSFLLISCNEDATKIFDAQNCLDGVDETQTGAALIAAAEACEAKLGSLDTSQANIIKCSTKFLAGGVTSTRIASAFSNNSNDGTASQTKLIAILSFTNYASGIANTKSSEALAACEKSGQKGLIFIAGLSKIGTLLLSASDTDCMDGACTDAEIAELNPLTNCTGDPTPAACSPAEVGNTAILISQSYCTDANKSDPVCVDILAAIAVGGDASAIGTALISTL
jgi:hypothetical protein